MDHIKVSLSSWLPILWPLFLSQSKTSHTLRLINNYKPRRKTLIHSQHVSRLIIPLTVIKILLNFDREVLGVLLEDEILTTLGFLKTEYSSYTDFGILNHQLWLEKSKKTVVSGRDVAFKRQLTDKITNKG